MLEYRMIVLNNWSIISDPYDAPELNIRFLQGNVFNSSKHSDGKFITTSRLVHVYENENGNVIATTASGTNYNLGNPDKVSRSNSVAVRPIYGG